MNKKVIGASVASLALAMVPVVGAFAATTRTDTLTVTIEKGCSFMSDAAEGVNHNITLGQGMAVKDIEGVVFNVTCNGTNDGTWTLTALGEGGAKLSDGVGHEIASTQQSLDGSQSTWLFKMNATGGATIETGYNEYKVIPGTATQVVKNTNEQATEDATISAFYGVSASATQDPGTYTGRVTYTLTNVPGGDV